MVDLGIPGYDSAEEIGRGGYATVYRVRRQRFGDFVAIKLIDVVPDERALRRVDRELFAVGKVAGHRNLVAVHDANRRFDGRPYIVMELVPGGTLAERAAKTGPLPWAEVVEIGAVLAAALQWAHDRGVIHRDVKPENVLIDDRFTETRDRIRLSDFGVAAIAGRTVTSETWSVAHAAPEVVLDGAAPSVNADLYGLASTLYQLLNGDAPFVREDDESLGQVFARMRTGTIGDLRAKGVPGPVATVIEQGLDADPAKRPTSAGEFASLLSTAGQAAAAAEAAQAAAAASAAEASAAATAEAQKRAAKTMSSRPRIAALLGRWDTPPRSGRSGIVGGTVLAVVVALVLATAIITSDGGDRPPTTLAPPSPSTSTAPTTTLPPAVVVEDNFAHDVGWPQTNDTSFRTAIVDEQYRVTVKLGRSTFSAASPRVTSETAGTRTRVQADATMLTPGATGLAGVTCRHSGNNYYYGQVGIDGHWRIGRTGLSTLLRNSTAGTLVKGLEANTPVRIRLECSRTESGVSVKLFINDKEVSTASDTVTPESMFNGGGVGFRLNPDTPGEWSFDNLVVERF